ncbi:MAG: BrnT family toxin [Chloroflexota bacterium]
MQLSFAWDPEKARTNLAKHGISFEEAGEVFMDPLSITLPDAAHSLSSDDREILVGRSESGQLLVVLHSEMNDDVRIISARRATRRERVAYEEGGA